MSTTLRGGHQTEDLRLDRVPYWDPQNENYPVRAILDLDTPPVGEKLWTSGALTDQGAEGACVGHGTTQEATASPYRLHLGSGYVKPHYLNEPDDFAYRVYKSAQKIDPWAGEDYEGTAVLAGVKVLKNIGLITEYRWALSLRDIRDTVWSHGPVILGINWYSDMYDTRPSGLVTVGGDVVGGHCITITGYDSSRKLTGEDKAYELYRWQNSWGPSYGRNGKGWIKAADLKRLVFDESEGEACVPVTRKLPTTYRQTYTIG